MLWGSQRRSSFFLADSSQRFGAQFFRTLAGQSGKVKIPSCPDQPATKHSRSCHRLLDSGSQGSGFCWSGPAVPSWGFETSCSLPGWNTSGPRGSRWGGCRCSGRRRSCTHFPPSAAGSRWPGCFGLPRCWAIKIL